MFEDILNHIESLDKQYLYSIISPVSGWCEPDWALWMWLLTPAVKDAGSQPGTPTEKSTHKPLSITASVHSNMEYLQSVDTCLCLPVPHERTF